VSDKLHEVSRIVGECGDELCSALNVAGLAVIWITNDSVTGLELGPVSNESRYLVDARGVIGWRRRHRSIAVDHRHVRVSVLVQP
jgi:hypothetical protein